MAGAWSYKHGIFAMARKGGKTLFEEWLSVVNGSAAYGNRYPGVWYSWREEKIIVVLALNGNPERWLRIPAGDLIAGDKTTSFKISQEWDEGKLMFKVNYLLLNSVLMATLSSWRQLE